MMCMLFRGTTWCRWLASHTHLFSISFSWNVSIFCYGAHCWAVTCEKVYLCVHIIQQSHAQMRFHFIGIKGSCKWTLHILPHKMAPACHKAHQGRLSYRDITQTNTNLTPFNGIVGMGNGIQVKSDLKENFSDEFWACLSI